MKNSSKNEQDQDAAWLTARVRDAGPWPGLAIAAGLAATGAAVGQAFAVAAFFQGWIFEHKDWSALWGWAAAVPLAAACRALAAWCKDEAGLRASRRVRGRLRADLIDRFGVLGPAWKVSQPTGALAALAVEQVDGLDAYVSKFLPQQALSVLSPLLLLAVVFPINWICGAVLLGTAPLIPLFMILVGLGARALQTKQLNAMARLSAQFLDSLRGLTALKLLNAHGGRVEALAKASEGFRSRTMEVLRLAFLSSATLEFFSVLAIALTALYLGFTLLGQLDFGVPLTFLTALFVLLLAPDFYQPLRDLGTQYHARAEALACAGRLRPVFEAPEPPAGGAVKPGAGAPSLRFRGVGFAYVPGVPVLSGFDLDVGSGETVAVTGPSGSGKTTVLRLLLAQLSPQAGTVEADGVPLNGLDLGEWREGLGWMSQHPKLLSATLADNLRVARRDADDTALIEALGFAGLGDWYSRLGQGLGTLLGEGGRLLSGGQLRRLALARVRLRNARLLLLDEPTASLDTDVEDLVLERLEELKRGRTVVLLSHHPRPLRLADRVIALGEVR
jgi:ATP-binding cassette subfamily C protein CydD